MSAREDYAGCALMGSPDGQILYSPPDDAHGWFYATGVADPSPETTALIRRLDLELADCCNLARTYHNQHPTEAPTEEEDAA